MERHRLQYLALTEILCELPTRSMRMLHFAPEAFFREFFRERFASYETADLEMENVDHLVDIQELPFAASSYDFVYASHVLEHVPADERALTEIRRILRPGGVAVLPVPIVADFTVEYPAPNPHEFGHVRAPGPDYFDRYKSHFRRVKVYWSTSFPERYQTFVYQDRSHWPTPDCPLLPPSPGERHPDAVPVCYA